MVKFLKRLFNNKSLSEGELAQLSLQLEEICERVEAKNLTLVSQGIESTSGHNNYQLVKAAVSFVQKCVWHFNGKYGYKYSHEQYFSELINYIKAVQHEFEQQNYDPDGAGGGTITDIIVAITAVKHNKAL